MSTHLNLKNIHLHVYVNFAVVVHTIAEFHTDFQTARLKTCLCFVAKSLHDANWDMIYARQMYGFMIGYLQASGSAIWI